MNQLKSQKSLELRVQLERIVAFFVFEKSQSYLLYSSSNVFVSILKFTFANNCLFLYCREVYTCLKKTYFACLLRIAKGN